MLTKEIVEHNLLANLDSKSLVLLLLTCKHYYSILHRFNCKEKIDIISLFNNDTVLDAFGGVINFADIPLLKWNKKFSRGDYIDNVNVKDLSHPIMMGIDIYHRPFVCFRLKSQGEEFVETVFKRYSNDVCWSNGAKSFTIFNEPRLGSKSFQYIRKLMTDGKCRLYMKDWVNMGEEVLTDRYATLF